MSQVTSSQTAAKTETNTGDSVLPSITVPPFTTTTTTTTPSPTSTSTSTHASPIKRRSITSIYDPFRPLALEACKRGWIGKKQEFSYWIPSSDIQGTIPPELVGTIFRNGPGVDEIYGTKLKHPIDGDGMICALTFTGTGNIHFQSRFVQHKARVEESYVHRMLYRGQMGTLPYHWGWDFISGMKAIMMGTLPHREYRNPSNTNVFYWGGKLVTCYETGLPHVLDPRTLETLGTDDLNGTLSIGTMAAHFRYDNINDRLVVMSLRPGLTGPGKLGIYEFDREWKLIRSQLHRIPGLNYAHDFLLTRDYYIFHMTPFVKMDMKTTRNIMLGLTSPGVEMKYYADLPSRMILIPRDHHVPPHQLIQIPVEPFHVFHFGNVKETHDASNNITTIDFNAVCLDTTFDMTFDQQVWLSNATISPGKLHHITLDVKNKTSTRKCVDKASVEFPSVHPYRHGQSCRYVWMMACDRPNQNLPYRDIVKYDEMGKRTVYHSHGCVGEPIVIPRHGFHSAHNMADEDDGWVFVQVFHPETQRTDFVILDAASMRPLCQIKLHQHIPYGFHGTHTPSVFVQDPMPSQPAIASPACAPTNISARL